ncbi:MAG: ATP-dependent zinc protease [Alphaproteobacteria bacterium]|nr:ATP-dependent zinc protease [Alphaproteobacteria bacterium]MBR1757060.1 ATP-dependent zinc protease [Alphaproteobacteria bacterium]
MRKFLAFLCLVLLTACAAEEQKVMPGIVPNTAQPAKVIKVRPNNVIGAVERIYFLPMKSPFTARVDTGATTSSIDADNIKRFERDGQKWVSFTLINRDTKEKTDFEKPLSRRVRIKRTGEEEHRLTVNLDVKMGRETFVAEFTLNERHDFEYQGLIGRNILSGRAVVDVSIANTLK